MIYDTWTTKDGRDLAIEEMETSHILNVISFLEAKDDFENEYSSYDVEDMISSLKLELRLRRN